LFGVPDPIDVFGTADRKDVGAKPAENVIATAAFSEGFNDITTLAAAGWVMTNHSTTIGTVPNWVQGNPANFAAQAGASSAYIAGSYNNTTGADTIRTG